MLFRSAATGVTSDTYELAPADAGHLLTVVVTASVPGYEDGTSTTAPVTPNKRGAPTALTGPSISGTPATGSTLSAQPGTWSVSGLAYAYHWQRDGEAIPGATAATYAVTPADAGTEVSVRVTATADGYEDGTATSASVTVAKLVSLTALKGPKKAKAAKLAANGAKVLNLRSVEYARRTNVPLHVRNSLADGPGTWVVEEEPGMEQAQIGRAHV